MSIVQDLDFPHHLIHQLRRFRFLSTLSIVGKLHQKRSLLSLPQIDILPTLLDIYGFSGLHSSLGSSLLRERKHPHALLLNEAITPISGMSHSKGVPDKGGILPSLPHPQLLFTKRKRSPLPKNH